MKVTGSIPTSRCRPRGGAGLLGGALLLAALMTAGCASRQYAYTPEALRAEASRRAAGLERPDVVVPFEVDEALIETARRVTRRSRTEYERVLALVESLQDPRGFNLRYESVATMSARDTVAAGEGNCLSLASLLVGLARGLGLRAYYVDASRWETDVRRGPAMVVSSGHISVGVNTDRGLSVVDFDGRFTRTRHFRILDDVEALAHFYNNLGYEQIHEHAERGEGIPWDTVREDFERATQLAPHLAGSWSNLGITYARLGRDDEAQRHYRAAITRDPRSAEAYNNLGSLLLRRGDLAGALESFDAAVRHGRNNPFHHYHRGLARYRSGDLEGAVDSLERAVDLDESLEEPRELLAMIYRSQGRDEAAERLAAR